MVDFLKQDGTSFFKFFFVLPVFLLSSCTSVQSTQSSVMNFSYHDARKIIIQNGWKPATGLRPSEKIGALARHFRGLGYAEVDDCAGDSQSPCLFYFQNDKGEYLKIGTEGEDNGIRAYPRVVYMAIRDKID